MTSVAAALAGEEATVNPKARVFGRRRRPSLRLPALVVAPAKGAAASRCSRLPGPVGAPAWTTSLASAPNTPVPASPKPTRLRAP